MTTEFSAKQPYEAYGISFDFAPVLGAETIASAAITAVDQATLVDVSTTILDVAQQSLTNTVVFGWVQGGTSGHDYLITCRIVGSAGSLYELEGVLPVLEAGAEVDTSINPPLATLSSLLSDIQGILQDPAYTDIILTAKINESVQKIAAGIRMPNGEVSPPLPDLYTSGTVNTSIAFPYVSLPANYQRGLFKVYDSTQNLIPHPRGGDYSSFARFMKQISNLGLTETGSIYIVCVKGTRIYYQGIPSAITTLGLHYYRKPVAMTLGTDVPEGIPEHLAEQVIKSHVLMNIMGEKIEAGVTEPAVGMKYWQNKFYEGMTDLMDFCPIDASPEYYGEDSADDLGACD